MLDKEIEIALCIPGPWADRSEFVEHVARDSADYIFAGMVLVHLETRQSFQIEFDGTDERMLSAFKAAGPHWRETPEMEKIASHKSVCYLIANGGSIESAHSIMNAANALLNAGGFGVKVESSGIAHPPKDWQEQCQYNYLFRSHSSYVVYITSDYTYSCGMHNFGLPDALVASNESENPVELLRGFTYYLLSESPAINEGQTFSLDSNSPVYRVNAHAPINYGEDSLLNNPYGTWLLELC